MNRKITAPMVALMRLPRKSGLIMMPTRGRDRAAEDTANQADGQIAEQTTAAAQDDMRQPAGNQADDDPSDNAH